MKFILFLVFLISSLCDRIGISLLYGYDQQTFNCLYDQQITFVNLFVYDSPDSISNTTQNLKLAKSLNIDADLWLQLLLNSAAHQVNSVLKSIPANLYGMVWINVQQMISTKNQSETCSILKSVVKAVKSHNKKVGINTQVQTWTKLVGNTCVQISKQYLWWDKIDFEPTFDNFIPFGGWTKPIVKTYTATNICRLFLTIQFQQ